MLGPLLVGVEGRALPVPSAKQRTLLACLLLRPGELVTVEELAEAIWGEALPAQPRRAVHTYVTRLRKLLGAGLLQSRPHGYLLAVDPAQTDHGRFGQLLGRARAAADAGDRAAEARALRQALGLWRGEPLADVPSAALHRSWGARLAEQRLEAQERRIDADLALGRHAELVGELRALAGRYPLRERLWAQLMTALYRCGRQADALGAYQRVRRLLAEELGIDPGPGLNALHQAVLTNDPTLDTPDAAAVREPAPPSQLPLDVDGFVGRDRLAGQVAQLLADDRRVPVVAVSGPPGVGKTALAVHAAHRLAGRFPDGQLHANLHGSTPGLAPLAPLEVLGRFLRALGTPAGAVPAGLEEASALFRSKVAGRRLLLLLDDAADAAQVAPLLPASPGCGVLVTSRRALLALDGGHHLHLDVLTPTEAVALLGQLAGRERAAAEAEAAAEVARCCGFLPLALRIAGARLAARPGWPVRALAERLADAQRRLDELELGEVGVRASFEVSYRQLREGPDPLDRAAAEAFGLLGVLDGPEVGVPVAARLLDLPQAEAGRALERLVDAQLLETPAPGRYRLHDLLRLYARELADQQHPEPARAAALARALGFYAATAWQTLALLRPGDHRLARADDHWREGGLEFADEQGALGWLEAERTNLLAAVAQAAASPGVAAQAAVQLAHALYGFFWVRSHWADWVRVNQTALEVASGVGDLAAQAQTLNDLGSAYMVRGRWDQALGSHEQSLALRRKLGDCHGEAASLSNLGNVHVMQGHLEQALACQEKSLAIYRELGDRRGQSIGLTNLGNVHIRLGRYADALACHGESLAISRELGDRHGEAAILCNLGVVHERQGRYQQALADHSESLAIRRELGDPHGQAESLNDVGVVCQRQGRYQQALAHHEESLALWREVGDPCGEAESLRELGATLRALGRHEEARTHWREALAIFEQLRTSDADQVRDLLAEPTVSPVRGSP